MVVNLGGDRRVVVEINQCSIGNLIDEEKYC